MAMVSIEQLRLVLKSIKNLSSKKADRSDLVQSNWDQNDIESNDYIKNRPFYTADDENVVPLPEKYVSYKPGRVVTGETFNVNGEDVTAESGAEIFNDIENNIATGKNSHAEGSSTVSSGHSSHAEGGNINVNGEATNVEFFNDIGVRITGTTANGDCSHAEGYMTLAYGYAAHSEGDKTLALGNYSHSEGSSTKAMNHLSHAEGYGAQANGIVSHAEGNGTNAAGDYSHAEGSGTTASKDCAHAEGYGTAATGFYSHSEGYQTLASGSYSHSEGGETYAYGDYSHTEGSNNVSQGDYSHTEGSNNVSQGAYSHSQGYNTRAYGDYSHTEGIGTDASGMYQHVQGRYNIPDEYDEDGNPVNRYAHIVGNGELDGEDLVRSNAHTLDWEGNAWFAGGIRVGGTSWDDGVDVIRSNPNLLINGDFQINQRGFTEEYPQHNTACYTVDRWYSFKGGGSRKVTYADQKITLTGDPSVDSLGALYQAIENLPHGAYTLSAKVNDAIYTYTFEHTGSYKEKAFDDGMYLIVTTASGFPCVCVGNDLTKMPSATIEWVKLECGTIATPFIPRLYGEELALCERYYQRYFNMMLSFHADTYLSGFPFRTVMRTTPNMVEHNIITSNGSAVTVSNVYVSTLGVNYISISGVSNRSFLHFYGAFDAEIQ